ncbi:MAG: hypothetical protein RIT45_2938 [Pseudomonadota bacterium]
MTLTPTLHHESRARQHPWWDFLHTLEKPARYTGGEFQQQRKDWLATEVRYALCFPDVYDIGMSHLGTKILYKIVNELPWALGERCFAPWPDAEAALRERQMPLISLENWKPLADFDVLGFSLQYELTFTNLLTMLDLGGVPLRNVDRGPADPWVIAGGPTATHPEPMTPFIDAFVVGDGEETLPRMLAIVRRAKAESWPRRDVLLAWAALGGVYCPDLYQRGIVDDGGFEVVTGAVDPTAPARVQRSIIEDIDRYPFPDDAPVAAAEAIFDRMSIEIARGCTEGCRFCQAGMIYRPVRERAPTEVVRTVLSAIDKAGYDEVSLTTLSTADYSCISPLVKEVARELRGRKASLSVASLRAYGLADDLLDEIGSIRASSLTFAPEAGSQRMRDVINKNVSEADLHATAHRVFSRNWRKVKCYFILGLPTESDEDIVAIAETGYRMREIGRIYKKDAQVTVSVSSHVPKPHTPFQWAAMDTLSEIERKQAILNELCRSWRLGFRRHDARTSYLEGVVGRGDRKVGEAVLRAWQLGARFDGWDEHLRFDAWQQAFEECGIEPDRYLGRLREDIALPWDHIDVGLADGFLAREWKRSLKDKLSPPCGKPVGMQVHHTNVSDAESDARKLVCYHCGVACDLTAMRDERIDYLRSLGAMAPAALPEEAADAEAIEAAEVVDEAAADAAAEAEATAEADAATEAEPLDPEAARAAARKARNYAKSNPRPRYVGPVFRYRVRFTKEGAEALTSHLDLVRSLPRVFRRAGVPLRYSDGYHQHPVISFAPALPLGTRSHGELMDVDFTGYVDPETLREKLDAAGTDGLRFLAVDLLPPGALPLGRALREAQYAITLRPGPDHPAMDDDDAREACRRAVEQALHRFESAETWPGVVERKRKPREIDLRTDVAHLGMDAQGRVRLVLRLHEQVSARPGEILAAALGELGWFAPVQPVDIERMGLQTEASDAATEIETDGSPSLLDTALASDAIEADAGPTPTFLAG